jgi:hypothetical protein
MTWPKAAEASSRMARFAYVMRVLLMVQVTLLAYSTCQHSPTINEPGHLVAGIYN